jgi:hypothetical protein
MTYTFIAVFGILFVYSGFLFVVVAYTILQVDKRVDRIVFIYAQKKKKEIDAMMLDAALSNITHKIRHRMPKTKTEENDFN